MTPVEAFDKLGFSPIVQAIGGLLWFSLVLGLMMRAEFAKRKANGNGRAPAMTPGPPTTMAQMSPIGQALPPAAHAAIEASLAKVIEIALAMNELTRTTNAKICQMQKELVDINKNLLLSTKGREGQIDEMIDAIKDAKRRGW